MQLIGRGGFGITFLAVDRHIPSQPSCVIKQLSFPNSNDATFNKVVELFRQEAVRLDELGKHHQIPQLLAHFEQEQQLYLVQEYIPGKTLSQELQQQGLYNEAQIWELLRDLLPVLQFIHKHRIIHRDIKPQNIIRRTPPVSIPSQEETKVAELVLIDFGIAKLLTHTALVQTGTIIGSPEYMPPEQTRGKVFPCSDLYSLGVTCIHLLTGVPPLDMFDVVNDRWAWQDFLPQGIQVSDRLAHILDKLLQNSLKNRYQSADEVLQAVLKPPAARYKRAAGASLLSQIGIDYTKLRDLLAKKKWKQADEETWAILCLVSGKPIGSYLFGRDIDIFPCEDLWIIDQLWVKYSERHFGFSVQKQIYADAEGEYPVFCDRVGWPVHNPHFPDSALNFSQHAPMGHLPSRKWVGGYEWWHHAEHLVTRLEQCGIGD